MSEEHIRYIMNKEKNTLELWDQQMIRGYVFDHKPFRIINNLKETIEDFEDEKEIEQQ